MIEAFRLPGAPGWTYAVQWHPEWQLSGPSSLAGPIYRPGRCLSAAPGPPGRAMCPPWF
nr:gamma-glutamyl-gamma-aminobutyrate hydrolase family protein [Aquaspirillum sp. LM1]